MSDQTWTCTLCLQVNAEFVSSCILCQYPRPTSAAVVHSSPPAPVRRQVAWSCDYCGFENDSTHQQCGICSHPIDTPPITTTQQSQTYPHPQQSTESNPIQTQQSQFVATVANEIDTFQPGTFQPGASFESIDDIPTEEKEYIHPMLAASLGLPSLRGDELFGHIPSTSPQPMTVVTPPQPSPTHTYQDTNECAVKAIPPLDYICHRCGISGHYIRDCPTIIGKQQPPSSYICHKCNIPGHWIADCPLTSYSVDIQPLTKSEPQPIAEFSSNTTELPHKDNGMSPTLMTQHLEVSVGKSDVSNNGDLEELVSLYRHVYLATHKLHNEKINNDEMKSILSKLWKLLSNDHTAFYTPQAIVSGGDQPCCRICYNEENIVKINGCNHKIICQYCLPQWIRIEINSDKTLPWLVCPAPDCDHPIHPSVLWPYLSLKDWYDFAFSFLRQKLATMDGWKECQSPNCSYGMLTYASTLSQRCDACGTDQSSLSKPKSPIQSSETTKVCIRPIQMPPSKPKSPTQSSETTKKADIKCKCGEVMKLLSLKVAYPNTKNAYCDGCFAVIGSDTCVYHCPKNTTHPNGYDYCLDCVKQGCAMICAPSSVAGGARSRFFVSDTSLPTFVTDRGMADKALLWNTGAKLTVLEKIYGKSAEQKKKVWRNMLRSLIEELGKYSFEAALPILKPILDSEEKLSKDFPFAAEVIHMYTLENPDLYKQLNLSLREAAHNKSNDYKLMRYCTALNVSLMSCDEYSKPTYRAARLTESDINAYRTNAGNWFFWPEFVSTTKNISLALEWIRDFNKNVLFTVTTEVADSSGRDISGYSKYTNEEEILYPSHSWYNVKRVYNKQSNDIKRTVVVIEVSYHCRTNNK